MSQIYECTLWNVISQQWNKTEIQFLLCMIQNTVEKHSNTFIVPHVFKQIWRWNYHPMNVSGYWSVNGKCRMLKFNDVRGLNWYTTTIKGINNKNPRQVWGRWNGARCRWGRTRSSTDNESADAVMQVFASRSLQTFYLGLESL